MSLYNTIAQGEKMVLYIGDDVGEQIVGTHWALPLLQKFQSKEHNHETIGDWLWTEYGSWEDFPCVYLYRSDGNFDGCDRSFECGGQCAVCLWKRIINTHNEGKDNEGTHITLRIQVCPTSKEFGQTFPGLIRKENDLMEENTVFPPCLLSSSTLTL